MSKRVVFLTMFVFCLLAGGLIWLGTNSAVRGSASKTQDAGQNVPTLDQINEAARAAKGSDEAAVRRLVDTVFNATEFAEVPPGGLDQIKERVVRAELNYRAKGKGGVAEKNITKMINKLANKLGAPDYAKTDTVQVRRTRVRLMLRLSSFISSEVVTEKAGKNRGKSSLKSEMSPLEAAYLATFLLQQKMLNEDYQLTPKESRAKLHKNQLERWEASRANKGGEAQQKKNELVVKNANPKREEMIQLISLAIAGKRGDELKSLAETSLDDLGIAR